MDQQEGAEPDAGKVVDDLVDVVLGSPRRLTRDEVAHLSGVPLDESRSLWRAMGFADVGDAAAFTDEDVDALVLLSTLERRGVFDHATAVDVVRALGRTTGRLASWTTNFAFASTNDGSFSTNQPMSDPHFFRTTVRRTE